MSDRVDSCLREAATLLVSEIKVGKIDEIYQDANEAFRNQSVEHWRSETNAILTRLGLLNDATITKTERLFPILGVYAVHLTLKFERGQTRGLIAYKMTPRGPMLVNAVLDNRVPEESH